MESPCVSAYLWLNSVGYRRHLLECGGSGPQGWEMVAQLLP